MRADNLKQPEVMNPVAPQKTLLTFGLIACNQDRYVREAVQAAFDQTYSPLEIILSDDCSDDRSFEIMREMAAAYRGPHKVVLNRNPVRKRTGGHLNRVLELAQGELIVIAAADDISFSHRTETAYRAWEQSGRTATSIYSDMIQIDDNGDPIEQVYKGEKPGEKGEVVELQPVAWDYVQTLQPAVHGCAHVISPRLFQVFGNMPDEVMYEDKVLAFRSVLAGKIIYINEPLLRYRLHGANLFKYRKLTEGGMDLKALEGQENRLVRDFQDAETMYDAFVHDLRSASQQKLLGQADFERISRSAESHRRRFSLMGQFLESGFLRKCLILLQLKRSGIDPIELNTLLKRLVPRSLFLRIRLARSRAASANQSGALRLNKG